MTEQPNNEPAFPCVISAGMSLRDWFAGQALSGLLSSFRGGEAPPPATCAEIAYWLADAMIAER